MANTSYLIQVYNFCLSASYVLFQIKCRRIPDPNNPGKKIDDYWGPAQQMLTDTNFLQSLKDFDKDHIPPDIIEKVRPYLEKANFDPEVVKKASKAAYGLCCWIRAMESYDKVAQVLIAQVFILAYISLHLCHPLIWWLTQASWKRWPDVQYLGVISILLWLDFLRACR